MRAAAGNLQRGRARRMMRIAACSGLATLAAACAQVGSPQSASTLPREAFDYVGWDQYLGGSESAQYSALEQIDKSNVGQLQVA
jgi:quinoprotein glucose dehydrogenase